MPLTTDEMEAQVLKAVFDFFVTNEGKLRFNQGNFYSSFDRCTALKGNNNLKQYSRNGGNLEKRFAFF